jgi:TRAP-type uncharacterized transport system fused permease subunit
VAGAFFSVLPPPFFCSDVPPAPACPPAAAAAAAAAAVTLHSSARATLNSFAVGQRLKLVHFTAQLEPCLTHRHTLHTLNTP